MNQTLHILINDENSRLFELTSMSRMPLYDHFNSSNLKMLQVLDYTQFEILMSLIPINTNILIWIHPNLYELQEMFDNNNNKTQDNSSTLCANNFIHSGIPFRFISRQPSDSEKYLKTKFHTIPCIDVLDLKIEYDKQNPIAVSDVISRLKSIGKETNLNYFDFAIITALYSDEFESICKIFSLELSRNISLGDKDVYIGHLKTQPEKKIVAIFQTSVGNIEAANLCSEIISKFNPRILFMTGVCGGSEDTNLGDIVIAKSIFKIGKGKLVDTGFLRELEFVKVNEAILRKVIQNAEISLITVKKELMNINYKNVIKNFAVDKLKFIIDPMACTDFVLDDNAKYFREVILSIDRKATAVDMESYAVVRAAESVSNGKTKAIIIKSVMDNMTNKDDEAKEFASLTSALFLQALLETSSID